MLFFYCLVVVMVMDNLNLYVCLIKYLEKGMDFGVSSNCFLVFIIILLKGIMINVVVEGKLWIFCRIKNVFFGFYFILLC